MKNSRLIINFLVSLLWINFAVAQESVNAAGGDVTGSGGSIAYSLGQVIYTTNANTSGTISQGVQQAYEIYSLGISETKMNFSFSIFPNPTVDYLTLQIIGYPNEILYYKVFDMQGKVLITEHVSGELTKINTVKLPASSYIIGITNQENKQLQSYKIIKY
jgi:hypothetical protein